MKRAGVTEGDGVFGEARDEAGRKQSERRAPRHSSSHCDRGHSQKIPRVGNGVICVERSAHSSFFQYLSRLESQVFGFQFAPG